jgi:hypothetical protein
MDFEKVFKEKGIKQKALIKKNKVGFLGNELIIVCFSHKTKANSIA